MGIHIIWRRFIGNPAKGSSTVTKSPIYSNFLCFDASIILPVNDPEIELSKTASLMKGFFER